MPDKTSLPTTNSATKPETLSFLMAEFDQLGEFWRHTDSRIDSAINFYLTTFAIVASGSLLLFQSISDTRAFVAGMIPVGSVLLLMGVFLSSRINSTRHIKHEYTLGLNRIRRFFVDNDPNLAKYTVLPVANIPGEPIPTGRVIRQGTVWRFLSILHAVNSLIAGGIIFAVLWLTTDLIVAASLLIALGGATLFFIAAILSERHSSKFSQHA